MDKSKSSNMYANSSQKENTRLKAFKNQGLDSAVSEVFSMVQVVKQFFTGIEKTKSRRFSGIEKGGEYMV